MTTRQALRRRRAALEAHLKAENPELLPVLGTCREFDRVLHGLGLLRRAESVAARLPWWPVVALVGGTGAGAAATLATWLGAPAAERAADGVIVFCCGDKADTVPAEDPRIPLDLLAAESLHVRPVEAEGLRGAVLVAAPAVAAPVVAAADLMLALPGAAIDRQAGGRVQAVDPGELSDPAALRARLAEAAARGRHRLLGTLSELAQDLEDELIPYLRTALARWRRGVRRGAVLWVLLLAAVLGTAVLLAGPENLPAFGRWLLDPRPAWAGGLPVRLMALAAGVGGLWLAGHLWVRRYVAQRVAAGMPRPSAVGELDARRAFLRNTRFHRSALSLRIAGWGWLGRRRFAAVRAALAGHGRELDARRPAAMESATAAQAGAGA